MKTFTKQVERCDECPNIGYFHWDGEGESAPYSYYDAECVCNHKPLPGELIVPASRKEREKYGYVPKRKIPKWCPLPDQG